MPRLWLLTQHFPPYPSGGVRRVGALASHLAKDGFEVHVFSSTGESEHRFFPIATELRSLSGRLHLGRLFVGAVRWSPLTDQNVLDWPSMMLAFRGVPPPDVIVASAPPHSLFLVAMLLGRHFGCPWAVDYRDPWTDHPNHRPPSAIHRASAEALENTILKHASGVLAATHRMAEEYRRRVPAPTPVLAFLNGFTPEHFGSQPTPPRRDQPVVGYYGSFYGALNPEPLVRAAVRAGARLEHAGTDFDGALARAAEKHGADLIKLGVLSSEETTLRMQCADVLALVLPDDPRWAYCRTQKLVEYVASGRPILGLVPEGEAAEVIRAYRAGITVSPSDVEGAADAIRTLAMNDERRPLPTELSWQTQVAKVGAFLRALTGAA